ncbi:MAG: hypothetical protein ACKVQS_07420 [Fimbriimonadaceae bacterium]
MSRIWLVGVFVGALAGATFGQNSNGQLLTQIADKVNRSGQTISYAAVRDVSIRSASGPRTFEEQILRSKGMLYLSYPKGSQFADQQIYERGGQRYTYTKSTNELRVAPARGGFIETVELLKKASSLDGVTIKVGDAVAGRPTIYIEIPSSRGRGGSHRLWIDREKYVVLKRTFGSTATDEIGGFEIIRIDYSAKISSSKFNWPKGAKVISVLDDLKRLAKELKLQPLVLKNSGKMALVSVGQMEFRGQKILRQFYTDGDKRLSLFTMKETDDSIEFRPGRVQMYQWNVNGMTLVLIGDYTESELKQLSKSVKS